MDCKYFELFILNLTSYSADDKQQKPEFCQPKILLGYEIRYWMPLMNSSISRCSIFVYVLTEESSINIVDMVITNYPTG